MKGFCTLDGKEIMKPSDSSEQLRAEAFMAETAEEVIGCPLERNKRVAVGDGVIVEPDLYSEERHIVCEIFAHLGKLRVGQAHKLSQDILKMLLMDECLDVKHEKYLVVAGAEADAYLQGRSFIAESLRRFGIRVLKAELPGKINKDVSEAQERQRMVNAKNRVSDSGINEEE